MSSGNWSPGEVKERAGLYNRFVSLANSRVNGTKKGVVGIPIKADWGPDGEIVACNDAADIITTFGDGGTTYLAIRAAKGGKEYKPYRIVIYRMASASASPAIVTVGETIKLVAKYKGTRGNAFKVSISNNIVDETKKDLCIYEKNAIMQKYTVDPSDISEVVSAINNDKDSLVSAVKVKDGTLVDVDGQAFSGGDSGETVTTKEYVNALNAFEAAYINTLALDGVTDEAILTVAKSWHNRVWEAGKMVQLCIGGSHEDDKDPKVGNARSKACNHYGIINAIVGGIDGAGNMYSSAEMAAQFAGAISALPLNSSLTYKELEDIVDVTVKLTDTEIGAATTAGSLTLFKDIDPETFEATIRVERGINTFTTYSAEKGEKLRKIKAISTMAAIDYDTGKYAMKSVIGQLDNDGDGQATLISGIKAYLETLVTSHVVSGDILVALSESLVTEGDIVYLETQAFTIDKIEQIFNKIYL